MKIYLFKYSIYLFLPFILFGCKSNKINGNHVFHNFDFVIIDSFSVTKYSDDHLPTNIIFFDKKYFYHHRYNINIIGEFSNQKLTKELVSLTIPSVNFKSIKINDSTIFCIYNEWKGRIDSSVYFQNINTLTRTYLDIPDTLGFQTREVFNNSTPNQRKIDFHNSIAGYGKPVYFEKSDKMFLVLKPAIDKNDTIYYNRSDKPALLEYDLTSNKAVIHDVRFSDFDNRFVDSLNKKCCASSFSYDLNISYFDDDKLIIAVPLSPKLMIYDIQTKQKKFVDGFPSFLDNKDNLFASFNTKQKEDIYEFYRLSHLNREQNLAFRYIAIPNDGITKKFMAFVYELQPEIKAIGILQSLSDQYYLNSVKNDTFFLGKRNIYNLSSSNLVIYKALLKKGELQHNPIKVSLPKKIEKGKNYYNYISEINPKLLMMDTIPIIFTYHICGTCISKSANFLQQTKENNHTPNSFILINSSPEKSKKFLQDFDLQGLDNMYIDSTNQYLKYFKHPNSMAYLIKDGKKKYRMELVQITELPPFLKFINPLIKINSGVCYPFENY